MDMVEGLKTEKGVTEQINLINKKLLELEKKQRKRAYPAQTTGKNNSHKNFLLGVALMLALVLVILLLKQNNGITGFAIINNPLAQAPTVDDEVIDELELENETTVIIELTADISALTLNMTEKTEFTINAEYDYYDINKFEGLNVVTARITKAGLEKLKQNPGVAAISFDKVLSISLQDSIQIINASNLSENNITGYGTNICLLDTGVDLNHPELNNSFIGGYDFVNNDNISQDDNNHGTHIAGIIHRINPNTKIIPVKVCDATGRCRASVVLNGISYCLQNQESYNISILSGSFGDGGQYNRENCPSYLGDTFNAIERANITSLFASGNNGYRNGVNYPACEKNVISVGATDKQDAIAGFTNTGAALDILAPGVNINSTIIGGYGALTGTSMSTPHASAAISILKANKEMNTSTARDILRTTGTIIAGYPRINLLSAIRNITNQNSATENETNHNCNELAANLDLTNEINITCFSVAAPDIIIDCQGHTINSFMEAAITINETGNRTTIRNCRFNSFRTAIKITNAEGVVLENPASNTSYNLSNAKITVKNDSFIEFREPITATGNDITEAVQYKNMTIKVDSFAYPQFNKTAEIGFNINFTNPMPGYDHLDSGNYSECPATRCSELNYTPPLFRFRVAEFTTYTVLETKIENTTIPLQNSTNETETNPINQTTNQTQANQTAANETETTPAQENTNPSSSFSSSPSYPAYSNPQPTTTETAEDAGQLQGFLEAIERREAIKTEKIKPEEALPRIATAEITEELPIRKSTPLGYALLRGTSMFKDNIDILIIITLIFCITGIGIYYKVYKATRTGIKKDNNKKQELLPRRIYLKIRYWRKKDMLKKLDKCKKWN